MTMIFGVLAGVSTGTPFEPCLWMLAIVFLHFTLLRMQSATYSPVFFVSGFAILVIATQNWWLYLAIRDPSNNTAITATALTATVFVIQALIHAAVLLFSLGTLAAFKIPKNFGVLNIVVALSWPIAEIFRSVGWWAFPMGFIGTAQIENYVLRAIFPIFGTYGVSFYTHLICFLLAVVLETIFSPTRLRLVHLYLCWLIFLIIVPSAFHAYTWTNVGNETLKVRLVHTNLSYSEKGSDSINDQLKLTALSKIKLGSVDLVVFPETYFIKSLQSLGSAFATELLESAKQSGSSVVVGSPFLIPIGGGNSPIVTNALIHVKPRGNTEFYAKEILVPFTEYLPNNEFLNFFYPYIFQYPLMGLVPGVELNEGKVLSLDLPTKAGNLAVPFSNLICYEVAFSFFSAKQTAKGNFTLSPSNDSWIFARQHKAQMHQFTKVRAAESERHFIRPNNAGITALINHLGQDELKYEGSDKDFELSFQARTGLTPYAKLVLMLKINQIPQY
jgi:apolipoprotein N-acyltransferase